MKKTEVLDNGLIRTYSDLGMKLIQDDNTDALYIEAIDPPDTDHTYTESDIPIPEEAKETRVEV